MEIIAKNAPAFGVIVASIGVIISLVVFIFQSRSARFRTSIELILKFDEQFNSESFKERRKEAASELLNDNSVIAEDIYDLFDTIGFLVRKNAINGAIAWTIFYYWIHGYWSAGKDHIENKRAVENDRTLWADFQYLHTKVIGIQRSEANQSEPEILDEIGKRRFLEEELIV
jgi:hypothetical protein